MKKNAPDTIFTQGMRDLITMEMFMNKNDRGNLLVIAGSDIYPGAATLCALGALKSGSGLVYVATTQFAANSLSVNLPEAIPIVCEAKDGAISFDSLTEKIKPIMKRVNCLVVGPGLSRTAEALKIVKFLASEFPDLPKVFDADALYYMNNWTPSEEEGRSIIITPHAGEAGHIMGEKKLRVNKKSAIALVEKTNCHVLLKGHGSIVATKLEGTIETQSVTPGSVALAVPGSGDVLAGAIGAFVARAKVRDMADSVVYYVAPHSASRAHALAGICLEDEIGVNGVLAREIAEKMTEFVNVH